METVMIHGSDGEVMAPFGRAGTFIRGKRICIIISSVGPDPDTPQIIKEALVGLPLDAMFTREQVIERGGPSFKDVLPDGCLLAYAEEVIAVLESANRYDASAALKKIAPNKLPCSKLTRY
jgi:hypothetical protein